MVAYVFSLCRGFKNAVVRRPSWIKQTLMPSGEVLACSASVAQVITAFDEQNTPVPMAL